jgi:putative addiction module component (TIGR02574 family)
MTSATKDVVNAALALSKPERIDAIAQLLDTLEDGQNDTDPADIDAAWIQEADRRYQSYRRGETKGVPIEDVLASLRERKL